MMHQCWFRVELSRTPSAFPFKGSFFTVTVRSNDSPILVLVSDSRGFLIWKSLLNKDGADAIYHRLLSEPQLSTDSFSFATEAFAFVFFDVRRQLFAFGKDRLGMSSLIWTRDPLVVASHNLDGTEHPPGFTMVTSQSFNDVPFASYEKSDPNDSVTVDEAMDQILDLLIRNVAPQFPVMFSGGLDSTLMAASLALSGARRVILLNFVANEGAPDRAAARASFAELRAAFPETVFQLREFTGDIQEMALKLDEIRGLLTPMKVSEMNLNIAMTLYCALGKSETFAAHSGLGADELFCGYLRMRSDQTVNEEVSEHMKRLWLRNGGRDDRVCLHIGKQCICPYLAPDFIEYALGLPSSMLIRPDLPRGQGEKWILRQIAWKYGLRSAAERPKQAMQFGSKVAKANWRGTEKFPES